jgi:hypothetical protein
MIKMKKIKKFAALAMIAFALVSLGIAARDVARAKYSAASAAGTPKGPGDRDGYYAVLFRGSSFCPTCDIMEEQTNRLMAGDSSARDYTFKVVNFELPGNEHYLFDYDLYTTTIVLIEQRGDLSVRWKNLQDSWEKAEKTNDFGAYLAAEMDNFRGEGRGA